MLAAHVLLSFSSHFAIPIRSFVMLSHGFLLDCGFVQVALSAARECHSRQADLCSISSDVPVTVEKGERHRFVCRRAGATPRNFWAAWPQKSRVAPARFSPFSTVTFPCTASCISSVSDKLLAPQGDETGEEGGGGCNPYLLHPSPSGSRSGAPTRRSNSVPKWAVAGWSDPPNS